MWYSLAKVVSSKNPIIQTPYDLKSLILKGLGLPCRGKHQKNERLDGVSSFLRDRRHLLHSHPQKHKGCPLIIQELIVPRPRETFPIINFCRDFIPWQEQSFLLFYFFFW